MSLKDGKVLSPLDNVGTLAQRIDRMPLEELLRVGVRARVRVGGRARVGVGAEVRARVGVGVGVRARVGVMVRAGAEDRARLKVRASCRG